MTDTVVEQTPAETKEKIEDDFVPIVRDLMLPLPPTCKTHKPLSGMYFLDDISRNITCSELGSIVSPKGKDMSGEEAFRPGLVHEQAVEMAMADPFVKDFLGKMPSSMFPSKFSLEESKEIMNEMIVGRLIDQCMKVCTPINESV